MDNKDKIEVLTSVVELFLPESTLEWFDIVNAKRSSAGITIILEEKNDPPLPTWYQDEKIKSKGFKDIRVSDFAVRGKKAELIFRRRTWKIEGHQERIKRDIKLVAEGTTLAKDFADFLKDRS